MTNVEMLICDDFVELRSSDKESIGAAIAAVGLAVWPGFILNETGREAYSKVQQDELGYWIAKIHRKGFYTSEIHNKVSKILNAIGVSLELELVF